MEGWKKKMKLEEDEFITEYYSEFFEMEISILFIGTGDEIRPKQTNLVNEIIANEEKWIKSSIIAIIDFYKKYYPSYKLGWELGGADEKTIEQYLPKEINQEKLLKLIVPSEIYITPEDSCSKGNFGFGLECEWDVEHGIGLNFNNWEVNDIGGMDVAFMIT